MKTGVHIDAYTQTFNLSSHNHSANSVSLWELITYFVVPKKDGNNFHKSHLARGKRNYFFGLADIYKGSNFHNLQQIIHCSYKCCDIFSDILEEH